MDNRLPLYKTDYLICWDFSDKDLPCVAVSKVKREGATIVAEVIGRSHEKTGCVSVLQILEDYETRQREEEERAQRLKDAMQRTGEAFAKAAAATTNATKTLAKATEAIAGMKED